MALLIDIKQSDWMKDEDLRSELQSQYPTADIRTAADPGNLDEIDMLTVSTYHSGEALRYPNLKLIQKTGAGVNNIMADHSLPEAVQIARLQTNTSGTEMAEYALAYVLQEQRHIRQYRHHQARSEWVAYPPRKTGETTVAVLGLGRIGQLVTQRFVNNGFQVLGWSRSSRNLDDVDCFAGQEGLAQMLPLADYVISVLPSTPQTEHIFNYDLLQRFKPESLLINVGRGNLVNEPDLIRALDDGLLAGAVLDVMSIEPLPGDHPLWLHPRIQLTPHISGYHLGDAILDIAENYRRLKNGEPLLHLVDRNKGY